MTFTIKNNEYNETSQKVAITAYRQRNAGKGALVNDIIGEKTIIVELNAKEEMKIEETLKLLINKRPTSVLILPYKPK